MGRGEKPRAASVMGLVSQNSFEAYGQLFLFRPLPVFKPFFSTSSRSFSGKILSNIVMRVASPMSPPYLPIWYCQS